MITINCTHCRAELEMDDAFAGGVCRCQHCGTIQTVPKHLKSGDNGEGQAVAGRSTTKPQFQTGRHGGTGLDELGDVVTSSGLSRSAMGGGGSGVIGTLSPSNVVPQESAGNTVSYATPRREAKAKKKTGLMIVLGGVAAAVIAAAIFFFALAGGTSSKTAIGTTSSNNGGGGGSVPDEDPDVALPKTPNFVGLDLRKASSVVYLIDRGESMAEPLDSVKALTYRSVESLGAGKKFAVLFWDLQSGSESVSYPESGGLAPATGQSVDDMAKKFEDVVGGGRATPITAMQRAATLNPTDVVFVTAKADDLDEDVLTTADQIFKGKAHIHAVAVGDDAGTMLKKMAADTGGSYQAVPRLKLSKYAKTH